MKDRVLCWIKKIKENKTKKEKKSCQYFERCPSQNYFFFNINYPIEKKSKKIKMCIYVLLTLRASPRRIGSVGGNPESPVAN